MGLTIHWGMQYSGRSPAKALEVIRQRAMDLPFDSVGEMVHLRGKECVFNRGTDDPLGWLKIQSSAHVDDPVKEGYSYMVDAEEILGFEIDVAPGSEPMNITLCKYPKFISRNASTMSGYRERKIPVGRLGWSGSSFCKTQYASEGGVPNFLRAHISAVTLLEFAQTLKSFKVHINDEGKWGASRYSDDWHEAYAAGRTPTYVDHPPQHDMKALIVEVGEWDEMIAGMFGALKDAMGAGVESPIQGYSDFEHLEMAGLKNMSQEHLMQFLQACKTVAQQTEQIG